MYNISCIPSLFEQSGITTSGPILEGWHMLVANELAQRINIPVLVDVDGTDVDVDRDGTGATQVDPPQGGHVLPIHIDFGTGSATSSTTGEAIERRGVKRNLIPIDWDSSDKDVGDSGDLQLQGYQPSLPVLSNQRFSQLQTLANDNFQVQKQFISNMTRQELEDNWFLQLACIKRQTEALDTVRKTVKTSRQHIRRLEQRLVLARDNTNGDDKASVSLDMDRRGRRLTWRTSVIVGLRKLMSIISANAFPLATLADFSRWTITRCEVLAWAVLCGRTKSWHQMVMQLLQELCCLLANRTNPSTSLVPAGELEDHSTANRRSDDVVNVPTQDDAVRIGFGLPTASEWCSKLTLSGIPGFDDANHMFGWTGTVGCTFWSGDATNASIWQRKKLQGIEICSAVLVDRRALQRETYDEAFTTMKCMQLCTNESSSSSSSSVNDGCFLC